MVQFALNHMSVPTFSWRDLLDAAADLGCVGVEFRNDLPGPLFGGDPAEMVAREAQARGLRVLGLSQVYPFNVWSDTTRKALVELVDTAQACGAESISLIPLNDGSGQEADLRQVLAEIRPILEGTGLYALIEPLGFARASLRSKADAIEAIKAVAGQNTFRIVHDTFHHALVGDGPVFGDWTGLVHISGVSDVGVPTSGMEDHHRVLVDAKDRLGNLDQITALIDAGFAGPLSMEAFSPKVHATADPVAALKASFAFIRSSLTHHRAR